MKNHNINGKTIFRKNRKRGILFLSVLLLIGLCSCNLASGEEGAQEKQDELIGAIVTREPIEKTYASFEWRDIVNANRYPFNVTFEGMEGQFFYAYEGKMSGADEKSYFRNMGNHIDSVINIREEENSRYVKLTADLYFTVENPDEILHFYLNPVYITSDHKQIYAVPGQGTPGVKASGLNSITMGETTTFAQEQKRVLLDKTEIDSFQIEVRLHQAERPLQIWISHMTADHQVMKKEKYLSTYELLKETNGVYQMNTEYNRIRPEPGTEYLLMEQEILKPGGSTIIERKILNWDGSTMINDWDEEGNEFERKATDFEVYYFVTDGFLSKELSTILWPVE